MELAGRMASVEQTQRELIPLTSRLVAIENELFAKTSTRELRNERARLQSLLDQMASPNAPNDTEAASAHTRQRLVRAETMQIEQRINKLDRHLAAHRPTEASVKSVLVIFGLAAIAVVIVEWLKG